MNLTRAPYHPLSAGPKTLDGSAKRRRCGIVPMGLIVLHIVFVVIVGALCGPGVSLAPRAPQTESAPTALRTP